MARAYNPAQYIGTYEGSARTPGFIETRAPDNSAQILEEGERRQQDFKALQRGYERKATVDRAELQADRAQISANYAKVQADFAQARAGLSALKSLAGLSGSLAKQFNQIHEINKAEALKQEQIDFDNSFLFGGDGAGLTDPFPSANESLDATAEYSSAKTGAAAQQELAIQQVAPGMPQLQEDLRAPTANYEAAKGIAKLNTHQAAAAIGPDLDAFMISDTPVRLPDGRTILARDARTASEISAVAQQGVRQLTYSYGISQSDPDTARKFYTRAARSAYNSTVNSYAKDRREGLIEDREFVTSRSASADLQGGRIDMQEWWNNYTNAQMATGGSKSFSDANKKVLDNAIETAKGMPPEQGIRVLQGLLGVQSRPGVKGTEIGNGPNAAKIKQAIRQIRQNGVTEFNLDANEVKVQMGNLKQRHNQAILKAQGDPKAIEQANLQYEKDLLRLSQQPGGHTAIQLYQNELSKPNAFNPYAEAEITADIKEGTFRGTEKDIDLMVDKGIITSQVGEKLKADLNGGPLGKTLKSNETQDRMAVQQGLQTIFKVAPGSPKSGQLRPVAADIVDRVQREVRLKLPRNASEAEINQAMATGITRELEVIKKQVAEGEVSFDPNLGVMKGYQFGAAARELNLYNIKSGTNPHTGKTGRNLSDVPTDVIASLNKDKSYDNDIRIYSDAILSREELQEAAQIIAFGDVNQLSSRIKDVAKAAGVTPTMLVGSQFKSQGGDLQKTIKDLQTAEPVRTEANGPVDMRTGALYLQGMGFTRQGAAYLAGNIQQESGWNGMRDWGQVAGDGTSRNGGLVSWASWKNSPARLGKIEGFLGKPIDKATHAEQLQAMLWEMKSTPRFSNAYRTFTNPNATPAQLRRASYEYWGYRDEGRRFSYANQLMQGTDPGMTYSTSSTAPLINGIKTSYGMDTSAGPDRGVNACAWAVNKVLASQGIASPWGNDVYVPSIKAKLDAQGKRVSGPVPGAIVIMQDNGNPPYPHIGIVQADGKIISNSSSRARFDRVETVAQTEQYYGKPNLYYVI